MKDTFKIESYEFKEKYYYGNVEISVWREELTVEDCSIEEADEDGNTIEISNELANEVAEQWVIDNEEKLFNSFRETGGEEWAAERYEARKFYYDNL